MRQRFRAAIVLPLATVAAAAASLPLACSSGPPTDCESNATCPATDATTDASEAESGATAEAGPEGGGPDVDAGLSDATSPLDAAPDRLADAAPDVVLDGAMDAPLDAPAETAPPCNTSLAPHDDVCVLAEALGVFVAPSSGGGSDTAGDGSRAHPYASIGKALASLGSKLRVYVCDGDYAEQVSVAGPVSLYGGLSCDRAADAAVAWGYADAQATIAAPDGATPLRVSDAGSDASAIAIEDFAIRSAGASGQDSMGNGLSSVAVLVSGSTVTFRRCALTAGSGGRGSDGTTGMNYAADAGFAPSGGANDGGAGGLGGTITCVDGTLSFGGRGGDGATVTGLTGADGGAVPATVTTTASIDGMGGVGGGATCMRGDPGANGGPGALAVGASAVGTLSASGWTPNGSGRGQAGGPGQGGGGGGGLAVPLLGGTGAGAGGCGGAGGTGGGGGGASIALASLNSNVTLDHCTLTTAGGGAGGNGAPGQPGQGGGNPASVTGSLACIGGLGGNGAGGGGGAGGPGGLSICAVYRGAPPGGSSTCVTGDAGAGGSGGRGGDGGANVLGPAPSGPPGPDGPAGLAQPQLLSP